MTTADQVLGGGDDSVVSLTGSCCDVLMEGCFL